MKKLLIILFSGLAITSIHAVSLYWYACVTNDTSQNLHITIPLGGYNDHAIDLDDSLIYMNGQETSFTDLTPSFNLAPGQYFKAQIRMENIEFTEDPDDYQKMFVTCNGTSYTYVFYNQEGTSSSGPSVDYDHTCTYDYQNLYVYAKMLFVQNTTPPFDCFFDEHYDATGIETYTYRNDMVFVDRGNSKSGSISAGDESAMSVIGDAPSYNY